MAFRYFRLITEIFFMHWKTAAFPAGARDWPGVECGARIA